MWNKMEDEEEVEKTDKRKPYTKTIYEYASVCSPHGIFYIFEPDRWPLERALWVVVVCIFTGLAIGWSVSAYRNWQDYPILTSVATTGYPIEKVPFPSITICAQGAANDIVDAALFKQFERYLAKKKLNFTALTTDEQIEQTQSFLASTYPGAKKAPNQLVRMMGSPEVSVEAKLESVAILNPDEFNNDCPAENDARKKRYAEGSNPTLFEEGSCPEGFDKIGIPGAEICIHRGSEYKTQTEAASYCKELAEGNGKLLIFDPNENMEPVLEHIYTLLKYPNSIEFQQG